MPDQPTLRPRVLPAPAVRLRCHRCEVAWSGAAVSPCWVCGDPGTPLNALVAAREQSVSAFDLDVIM